MRLACLFSGGKDSTYAIHLAQKLGHKVKCLLTIHPKSDESHLLHHPNIRWTGLQSESMNIPQLVIRSDSDDTDDELSLLEGLLQDAIVRFGIDGVVHGGIGSRFQRDIFERVCSKLNLGIVAPLWGMDSESYMNKLVDSKFDFIITAVSSGGLDGSWLGRSVSKSDVTQLKSLSERFGFGLNFEGGEAETFVIDCPLFASRIKINQSRKDWNGYNGRFEIVDAKLDCHA